MTRWKRILISLLLPAPIGLVFVYGLAWVNLRRQGFPMTGHIPTREDAREGLGILIFAYLFAIIPSILFTLAMEWLYKRRSSNPGSGTAVSASTVGGTLSGFAIGGLLLIDGADDGTHLLVLYPLAGALTGLILATLIKLAEKRAAHTR